MHITLYIYAVQQAYIAHYAFITHHTYYALCPCKTHCTCITSCVTLHTHSTRYATNSQYNQPTAHQRTSGGMYTSSSPAPSTLLYSTTSISLLPSVVLSRHATPFHGCSPPATLGANPSGGKTLYAIFPRSPASVSELNDTSAFSSRAAGGAPQDALASLNRRRAKAG